jgi:prefoldin subunit 5
MSWLAVNSPGQESTEETANPSLPRDQLILRVAGMSIVSEDTGRKASLRVRRKFSLIGQQTTTVETRDIRGRSPSLIPIRPEYQYGHCPPEATMIVPKPNIDPLPELLQFADWAKSAIEGQKRDIDRINSIISRMDEDMQSFKDYMTETVAEIRQDQAASAGAKPWERMSRDVKILQEEVGQVRMDLENRPGQGCTGGHDEGVSLSVEELDVLTSSITKISQKVNEVESLKLELQFMKTRLKRFEDVSRNARDSVGPRALESTPAPSPFRKPATPQVAKRVSLGNIENEAVVPRRASGELSIPRKRKSDDFNGGASSLRMTSPATEPRKRRISSEVPPAHRPATTRKPSRLSNVQLLDDVPDPLDASTSADGTREDDDDIRPPGRTPRAKPSSNLIPVSELRPTTRKRTLLQRSNLPRDTSTPEPNTHPSTTTSKPAPRYQSQAPMQPPPRPNSSPSPGRRGRRAYSEGLRNAEGVRITKNGTPDRRSGNYKYLKQYYEKLKAEKDNEDGRSATPSGNGNETDSEVLPSIEGQGGIGVEEEGRVIRDGEDERRRDSEIERAKQAALDARDRLVRETLERELGL